MDIVACFRHLGVIGIKVSLVVVIGLIFSKNGNMLLLAFQVCRISYFMEYFSKRTSLFLLSMVAGHLCSLFAFVHVEIETLLGCVLAVCCDLTAK